MPSSFRTPPIQVLPTPQHVKETLADAISICRSCSKLFRSLHSRAITCGLQSNLFLSSILITKYFAFGDSCAAQLLFDSLPVRRRKPLLWNSLISGYLRCQLPRLALDTFRRMVSPSSLDCDPDKRTFHLALTACARLSEFKFGLTIGDRARSLGFQSDLLVATALVVMYARSGELESARQVFDQMPVRDPVCWNAMVSGYSQAGLLSEAVELFRIMRIGEGIGATEGSLVSLLSSFGNDEGWVRNGEILHAVVVITGFEENVLVLNSLLEMYVEFGCLEAAVRLFDSMVLKDSISWSTMIGGYVKNGKPSEALKTFYWMLCKTSILPVRPILVNAFLACASLGDWEAGEWIQKKFLLSNDDDLAFDGSLATALIYMYARCKKPGIALQFLETDERVKGDVIAWNAVIKACAEVGDFRLVFELALKMQRRGVNLDKASYLMLLSVISTYALSRERGATHTLIVKTGFGSERSIANSLIDVYAQFGSLEDVDNVFKDIKVKDVISWSLIIRAYALNGNADGAFEHFSLMRSEKSALFHLADMAPAKFRGMLNFGFQLIITIGILSANVANYGTVTMINGRGWRVSLSLAQSSRWASSFSSFQRSPIPQLSAGTKFKPALWSVECEAQTKSATSSSAQGRRRGIEKGEASMAQHLLSPNKPSAYNGRLYSLFPADCRHHCGHVLHPCFVQNHWFWKLSIVDFCRHHWARQCLGYVLSIFMVDHSGCHPLLLQGVSNEWLMLFFTI